MTKSRIVAVVSDIHFDSHDIPTWRAFKKWQKAVRPAEVVVLGDFLDFGMLSSYRQGADDAVRAVQQIKVFVNEINSLVSPCKITVMEGNHDERWQRALLGANPTVLSGAKGLSLYDQCKMQGLRQGVHWIRESTKVHGIKVGSFLLRHGHKQQGRFGGGKHLAATRLEKSMGQSEVFGHHHVGQMFAKTAGGRTAVAISNPCMTTDHEYCTDPNWQRGFTILEVFGERNSTAYPIIMDSGRFAWGGKVYDGNIR